jgi:DNA-directed RNA polymerase subunit alpha
MQEPIELAGFFDLPELTAETIERYADAAHASASALERFQALVRERETSRGDALKLALGLLILGRFAEALEAFERAPAGKIRHWFAAQAALGSGRLEAAIDELKQAARHGWDALETDLKIAVAQLRRDEQAAAEKLLAKHAQAGQDRAQYYFVLGLLADHRGDREAALAALERCLTLDPDHPEAMFRAARLYDAIGDDEKALELYQLLALQPRAHVNALLNAAVVYEDIGRYDEAAVCLRRVLRTFPNHNRARLFLKDVESCQEMVIDDAGEQTVDARARLLETPISEFELSVRARNCLKRMNIRTLGELIRLSEPELLAYKNFGETSLNEIKALLSKKSLRLGQTPDEIDVQTLEVEAPPPKPPVPAGQEAVLAKSVSDLELSVRARRCLQRLNVQTLADLMQYSEADLLATRNFGVTSLNEVKGRLADFGLELIPKKPA